MPEDLNNDGVVDAFDLSILLSHWGTDDATADINQDGTVDTFDLSLLVSEWGAISGALSAPEYLLATQGPTDPNSLYVWVTWRHVPEATGYEVFRDGASVATVPIGSDSWSTCAFKDSGVTGSTQHNWTIVAHSGSGTSGASSAASLYVRTDADLGLGNVHSVDAQSGATTNDKIANAIAAAKADGGGVVQFSNNTTYTVSSHILLSNCQDVILRGGSGTIIKAGFSGNATNGNNPNVIRFQNTRTAISATLSAPIEIGDTAASFSSTSEFSVGDYLLLDWTTDGNPSSWVNATDVIGHPGSGIDGNSSGPDDGRSYEILEITAINGSQLTFANPSSARFAPTPGRPLVLLNKIVWSGSGIEQLRIEGPSASSTNYVDLVSLDASLGVSFTEVDFEWANSTFLRRYNAGYLTMVGCTSGQLGPRADGNAGSSMYCFNMNESVRDRIISNNLGSVLSDINVRSLLTFNRCNGAVVRNNVLGQSGTYQFNEHGFNSRYWSFENNRLVGGPRQKFAGVFLGNSDWGFSGAGIVMNNLFDGNNGMGRGIYGQENTYEVRVLGNVFRNIATTSGDAPVSNPCAIQWYGWAGPDTDSSLYGSGRWTIRRNTIESGADEVRLSNSSDAASNHFPTEDVRDFIYEDNTGMNLILPATGSGSVTNHHTWDDSIESWAGATLAHETTTVHSGSGALAVTFPSGMSSEFFYGPSFTATDLRPLGDTLGVWIYVPASATGTSWYGAISVHVAGGAYQSSGTLALTKGEWSHIKWTPDSSFLASVDRLALSLYATGDNGTVVYFDDFQQADSLGAASQVERVPFDTSGGDPAWATETFFA